MIKRKEFLFCCLLLSCAVFIIRCSDPVSCPPDIPLETLLAAPDTLEIGNQSLVLSTNMWRDFQPISPPEGRPLIIIAYIETADSSDISSSIIADAVYIVYNNQVWKSFFSDEEPSPGELRPFRIVRIARDGPKWGPDIYIDVIVRLTFDNDDFLLRASEQYIGRTD